MNRDQNLFLEKNFDDFSNNKNVKMMSKNHFIITRNIKITKNVETVSNFTFTRLPLYFFS